MKHIPGILIFLSLITPASAQKDNPCDTVRNCMSAFEVLAEKFNVSSSGRLEGDWQGLSEFESHAVKLGDPLVDELIPLLGHEDMKIAIMATEILTSMKRIDKKYLPQIVAGLDRGTGWLHVALARIGTDEAAEEAVKRFLVSPSPRKRSSSRKVSA